MGRYEGSFKQKCAIVGISYKAIQGFIKRYELYSIDDDSIIKLHIRHKIAVNNLKNKELSIIPYSKVIGEDKNLKCFLYYINILEELYKYEIDSALLLRYMKNHSINNFEIGIDKYAKYISSKNNRKIIEEELNKHNISYDSFYYYRNLDKNSTNKELIEFIKSKQSLRAICKDNDIDYVKACEIKRDNPDYSIEQLISETKKHIKSHSTNYIGSFKEKCDKALLNYNSVKTYKNTHGKELTDNQVICQYNPNCYINILGQLVIPQEDGTKIVLD